MSDHILYRAFGADGQLLYVGKTACPASRLRSHSKRPWWSSVTEIKLAHFSSADELADAEREAIRTEGPVLNAVRYTGPTLVRPRRPAPTIPLPAFRKALGLTVEQIADRSGCSQRLVEKVESGTIPPSDALLRAYGLPAGSVVTA